jgi:hypothetical protein
VNDGGGRVIDCYLIHQHYLQRYSTHEANTLLKILDTSSVRIKELIARAKAVETKEKYRRISAEIRRIQRELSRQLYGIFETDGMDLIVEEIQFVDKVINKDLKINLDLELPAAKQVWAAASFGSYSADGHETFATYLNGLSENLYKVWDTNVRAGYLAGLTAQQINRAVLGNVRDMEPGQIQGLRKSLERNTRTMITSLAETARDAVYRENEDIFSGYKYLATLDTRTCLVCAADDGKIFKNLDEAPKLPRHLNDRCLYVPYIKGFEDIPGERAAMDGPVSDKMTYQDWLARQDPEIQKEILGPARYPAYKNGMPVSSFVSGNDTLTLRQLMEKEGLEFFGAGLKTGSWQVRNAYADTYYEAVRNRKNPTDIGKIAENTGFSDDNIRSIRDHVFIKEHDLGEGVTGRFAADWQIAQAWQRMEQGWKGNDREKYHDVDLLLLRHELEELTVMAKYGYNYPAAHEKAEEKYPWDVTIDRIG